MRTSMPPRILLVDGDRDRAYHTTLGQRLRCTFRSERLEVEHADCVSAGLILAGSRHYDALIVDWSIPGSKGFTFIKQLRIAQPEVAIVVMGDHEVQDYEEHAIRLKLTALLLKPTRFSELCTVLAEILANALDVSAGVITGGAGGRSGNAKPS
ncbi:response regulator [Candidatus Nitrospira bockiana]